MKKISLFLVKTDFWLAKNSFTHFVKYFWLSKQFLRQVEMYSSLIYSSFRQVETDFLSMETVFFYPEFRWSFRNSGVATFLREPLNLLVGTDFLADENQFFHFFDTSASESYFSSSGNIFFREERLFLLVERDFLSSRNWFLLFRASFLQVETISETSWNSSLYFL